MKVEYIILLLIFVGIPATWFMVFWIKSLLEFRRIIKSQDVNKGEWDESSVFGDSGKGRWGDGYE